LTTITTSPPRRVVQLGLGGNIALLLAVVAAVYLISGPLITLLVAAFRGPLDRLLFESETYWTFSNFAAVYLSPRLYSNIIPSTAIFVAGSVALTFFVAFTLAWLVERTDLPLRTTVFTCVLFPLLVPTVVLALAWTFLLGPRAGLVNVAIRAIFGLDGDGPIQLFSMGGLIFCQGLALVPFVFLLLGAALRSMNPALEEASAASGASPFTTFFHVTLRVLLPGILAPLILATLITLEQFEMPLMIGRPARINVFSTQIYYDLNPDSEVPLFGRAAAISVMFLCIGGFLLYLYNRAIRRADAFVTVSGKGYRPTRIPLGRWKIPALIFVFLYVSFAVVLPVVVLLLTSLYATDMTSLAALSKLNFAAYVNVLSQPALWLATRNTFLVAAGSAVIVTFIGLLLSWAVLRTQMRGRGILDFISFASLGIPSVIAGLAVMLLYLMIPIGIYGTVWILIIAYSYRLAVATRLSRAALMQIHAELEEASYVSGGRWIETIRHVVLPILAPSLLASFTLLFIVGFREFTIPLILQGSDNVVLSTIMWNLFLTRQSAEASAVAVLIIVLVIPVIVVLRRQLLKQSNA
jgi:iron(III) transport system permease protein